MSALNFRCPSPTHFGTITSRARGPVAVKLPRSTTSDVRDLAGEVEPVPELVEEQHRRAMIFSIREQKFDFTLCDDEPDEFPRVVVPMRTAHYDAARKAC